MSTQTFYGKGPHLLLWFGSRAARGKISVSGIPNCLNYCVIFIVYTWFTNVVTDHYWWIGNSLKGSWENCPIICLEEWRTAWKNSGCPMMSNDLARIQTRYLQNRKQVTICGPSACEGLYSYPIQNVLFVTNVIVGHAHQQTCLFKGWMMCCMHELLDQWF
jgi:hypothetical protein